jgi:hypothetical protein
MNGMCLLHVSGMRRYLVVGSYVSQRCSKIRAHIKLTRAVKGDGEDCAWLALCILACHAHELAEKTGR